MEINVKFKSFEANYKKARPISLTIGILLIFGGISLLSQSFFEYIFGVIINKDNSDKSPCYAWLLIFLGISISFFGAYLNTIRKRRIQSDVRLYKEIKSFVDETFLMNILKYLKNENAIYKENNLELFEYYSKMNNSKYFFQTTSIQNKYRDYKNDLQKLNSFISINFTELSFNTGGNIRLHLKPNWNIDFSDSVSNSDYVKYDELDIEKNNLLEKVELSYNEFIKIIRKELDL